MITKNYIKMCEKAEEIQKLRKGKNQFSNQDFVAYNFGSGLNVYVCNEISRYWTIQDLIWLPTQEQLMEIVYEIIGLGETHLYGVIQEILKFLGEEYKDNSIPDEYFTTTKEKLLAFIMMRGDNNKIWIGEVWKEVVK